MSDKNYVCYHLHTELSLLDSCTNFKSYADKAVELGQKAICFTEHGNIYNWVEKKMYVNKVGLKYLHGVEIYLTKELYEYPDIPDKWYESMLGYSENEVKNIQLECNEYLEKNKKKVRDNFHTILIAKNYDGVKEINTLVDLSTQEDHFYYKPRITLDEFKSISNNVIKISACLASPLNKLRDESLIPYYDYLEIQPHINSEEQKEYNKWLYKMSEKYNKPLIAATDTHSLSNYKAECRSILQKAKNIQFTNEDEFDLTYKSYDELVNMFKEQNSLPMDVVLKAIENTNKMADSVVDFELDTSFKYPKLYDNEEEVLKKRINKMYKDKLKRGVIKKDPRYKKMVHEEMRVFKKIGMVGFMLFMSELVCWCWENGIPVGFCRGSCGGSIIAYLTDIIDVNPLTWHTMFSRFANESRKELGDIDVDISPSQRHLVYNHIIEEFGQDKTAYILAVGTISDKGTIDEIGRALSDKWIKNNKEYLESLEKLAGCKSDEMTYWMECEIIYDRLNKIKENPDNPYSLSNIALIKKEYDIDPEKTRKMYPELFYYFDGLKGTAISQSMHPAGIIVSPVTLPDNYGTFWNDGKRILCINMEEAHEVSLNKYDILGLKNIEIIKDTCELAGIPYPKSHEINWNDKEVWRHITDSPVGIFQFESPYAFKLLKDYHPSEVNSLSLVNASLRPSGESYRDRLISGETNKNPSELIDNLLAPNKGFLVFQEDTIKFLQQVCGLSGSEADNVRRAIGRKQKDRLDAAMPQILEGYCKMSNKPREIAEQEAKEFLRIIEDSANYQFGYNHSTGYSMIGYTCGYLRYYYPKEFITAYLNNANNEDDINMGTELASQFNIEIHPIKFRHSTAQYSCDKNGIYKGLLSIKFLSEDMATELYELGKNSYDSFIDLLADIKNTSVDSRQLNILISLDFFSEFGEPNMLLEYVKIFDNVYGKKTAKKRDGMVCVGDHSLSLDKFRLAFADDILENGGVYKETEKQIKGFNSVKLVKIICCDIVYPKTTIMDKIRYELEYLGYITCFDPNADKNLYYVTKLDIKKSLTKVELYEIHSGKSRSLKMWTNAFDRNPFAEKDVLNIYKVEKKNKRQPGNKINPKTGKIIWEPIQNEFEYWLQNYSVQGDEEC